MKVKITERQAKDLWNLYKVGYCDLQETLRNENPIFYTAGIYGRKADFYRLTHSKTGKTIRISTGYGPIGKETDRDTIKKIEEHSKKQKLYSKRKRQTIKKKNIDYLINNIDK